MELSKIEEEVKEVITQLLTEHPQKEGSIFVIGCSSSEVAGGTIGHLSSEEIGKAIYAAAKETCDKFKVYLACQCCEHLNRALVVSEECAEKYNLEPVSVVPWLKGGGSFATAAYRNQPNPVVVEHVKASAGIDIGSTLIGMHLKDVAVPFRPATNHIENAYVTAAYSRPKLIGGERARYSL